MKPRHLAVYFPLSLSTLMPAQALLGQEVIASDRPGIGSGSYVLELGTVQAEVGAAFARAGQADLYSLGQAVLRLGLPWAELQAYLNSYVFQRSSAADNEGFQDLGVGMKGRLWTDPAGGAAVSALATLSLPSGSDFLTAGEFVPSLTVLADYPLSGRLTVTANLGYVYGTNDLDDVVTFIVTPAVALPLALNVGAYFGYAGFYSKSADQHLLEWGLTLLALPDWQVDVNSGVEPETGDYFVGVGAAGRWLGP